MCATCGCMGNKKKAPAKKAATKGLSSKQKKLDTNKNGKLEGGVPAKGADAHFLKEGDRATKLDVQVDKEEKKKATPAPKKGKSLTSNLKDKFSANKILNQQCKSNC